MKIGHEAMSARTAKNGFRLMADTGRAEPVLIEKHGRGVVVVVSVEEFAQLNNVTSAVRTSAKTARKADIA